ncbi:MAG: hypothetical protein K2O59_16140 [Lachnospiraceae bacterium]|nr:hypothetical protein [Lachnospiraceae bacterium]
MLQKAMVFTLTAAMLVGTPMTASAAGLVDLYSVSDGSGPADDYDENMNPTGTVTNTNTKTGVLSDNETKIVGFVLDQDYVSTEVGANPQPTLTATVILDGTTDEEMVSRINGLIRWETSDNSKVSIKADASDRTVVTLNPKKAANVGDEVVITASIGGKYPFEYTDPTTGEKKTIEGSEVLRTATAKVFVKEYTTTLSFTKEKYNDQDGVLVKHTLDMNKWLNRKPITANDSITWSISKTSAATISNDGVVTLKKFDTKKPENNTFKVTAVSEKGAKATAELTVGEGVAANSVKIFERKDGKDEKEELKGTVKKDAGGEENWPGMQVHAKMEPKEAGKIVTDKIKWNSNRPAIVEVTEDASDSTLATLVPKAIGTAKITATATSGKKSSFSVKVSATLNGLKIAAVPETAYTGQSITLDVVRDPAMNKDALSWSVWEDEYYTTKSKDVTINAKGVLKVKNTLKADKVYVKVQSKKDKKIANTDKTGNTLGTQKAEIKLQQSSINGITVTDITNKKEEPKLVTKVWLDGTRQKKEGTAKTEIRIPINGVYQATVEDDLAAAGKANNETLSWTNSNSKVAEMTVGEDGKVTIKPMKKGTTKITASGIKVTKWNDEEKKSAKTTKVIKAQFTVNVIQPTTSLKLNKTDIVLYPKANNAKQTVSLKATMNPKGAADAVKWTVTGKDKDGKEITVSDPKVSGKNGVNGKVELAAPALGDVYTVKAISATGVSATAKIKVLKKPTSVEIHDPEKDGNVKFSEPKATGNGTIANTKYVEIGKSFEMKPEINLGTARAADWVVAGTGYTEGVTYTQSGAGKVNIIGNKVYGVKEGKVTITAKTPNNKKTTLKVEVRAE